MNQNPVIAELLRARQHLSAIGHSQQRFDAWLDAIGEMHQRSARTSRGSMSRTRPIRTYEAELLAARLALILERFPMDRWRPLVENMAVEAVSRVRMFHPNAKLLVAPALAMPSKDQYQGSRHHSAESAATLLHKVLKENHQDTYPELVSLEEGCRRISQDLNTRLLATDDFAATGTQVLSEFGQLTGFNSTNKSLRNFRKELRRRTLLLFVYAMPAAIDRFVSNRFPKENVICGQKHYPVCSAWNERRFRAQPSWRAQWRALARLSDMVGVDPSLRRGRECGCAHITLGNTPSSSLGIYWAIGGGHSKAQLCERIDG